MPAGARACGAGCWPGTAVTAGTCPGAARRTRTRVWVSEVMLQQTRVETARGYYERFLARFPTVEALAAADEGEVLKAWEGMGYYSRARNLHRAARAVAGEGTAAGCRIPTTDCSTCPASGHTRRRR